MIRMPRRTAAAVAETRTAVTRAAVDRASVEGLEGLTIGGLAGETEMRKSSVFSLFGSKEELQLATLEAAIEQFTSRGLGAGCGRAARAGPSAGPLRQLARLPRARGALPGGCFLTTATVEYDARPGAMRDEVQRTMDRWLGVLEREATAAIQAGDAAGRDGPGRPRLRAQRARGGGELRLSAVARQRGLRPRAAVYAPGARGDDGIGPPRYSDAVSEGAEQLILKMVDIFNREGIEAAIQYFDPELVWVAPPDWLEDPIYRGHEGIRRLTEMWTSRFGDYRLEVEEFIDLGDDRFILLIHQVGEIPSTSDTIKQPVGWVVQMRDGKLARVEVFFSWEETKAAAGVAD